MRECVDGREGPTGAAAAGSGLQDEDEPAGGSE